MTPNTQTHRKLVTTLFLAVLLPIAAAHAEQQTITHSEIVCLGSTQLLEWNPEEALAQGYEFEGLSLIDPTGWWWSLEVEPEANLSAYIWHVGWNWGPEPGYNVVALYRDPETLPDPQNPMIGSTLIPGTGFEIRDCSDFTADQLAIEVAKLEEQLWQEHYLATLGPQPSFPHCASCAYRADLLPLFLALDRAEVVAPVQIRLLDLRHNEIANLGLHRPRNRGFAGLERWVPVVVDGAFRRETNCGLLLEVARPRGETLTRSRLCVRVFDK